MPTAMERLVRQKFAEGDAAATSHARGQALETLTSEMFSKFKGVRLFDSDVLVANGSEELDVFMWNDKLPSALDFLEHILLFECKNWSEPVNSATLAHFIHKVRSRKLQVGFLVAAAGITGDENDLTAAHQHIDTAFTADNTRIIVLTRTDLFGLRDSKDLRIVLQDKLMAIVARKSFG